MFEFSQPGMTILRMVLIFGAALVVVRLMGNRAVGQLSPFDFVLMVGIGDIVANVAMDNEQSLMVGGESLIGLLLLQQVLSRLSLKSRVMRKWFEGKPVELVEDGNILYDNMRKTQFNLDDLRQELHKLGMDFSHLKDIKLARLESCGDFSIIKQEDVEPLTKREFMQFMNSATENPLSPAGAQWVKIERLMEDVGTLADYVRSQQVQLTEKEEEQQSTAKNLH